MKTGASAAAELAKEYNDEIRAEKLKVELMSTQELTIDVVDGELRIRRSDQIEEENQ